MLRITVHKKETVATVQLEGRLAGLPAVTEVKRCWKNLRSEFPDWPLRIDLRAVTFIDREGKLFLQHAFHQGAGFLFSGCLTRAYVEEITGSAQNHGDGDKEERTV